MSLCRQVPGLPLVTRRSIDAYTTSFCLDGSRFAYVSSVSNGFALAETVQQHIGDLFAILVGFLVGRLALGAGEAIAQTIEPLERQPDSKRRCPGNAGLGNQSSAEGDFGHQFTRDRPPAEGARYDGTDLRALLAITDAAVAGGGQQKSHSNLIHGEKRGVGSEFADGPGNHRQTGTTSGRA